MRMEKESILVFKLKNGQNLNLVKAAFFLLLSGEQLILFRPSPLPSDIPASSLFNTYSLIILSNNNIKHLDFFYAIRMSLVLRHCKTLISALSRSYLTTACCAGGSFLLAYHHFTKGLLFRAISSKPWLHA